MQLLESLSHDMTWTHKMRSCAVSDRFAEQVPPLSCRPRDRQTENYDFFCCCYWTVIPMLSSLSRKKTRFPSPTASSILASLLSNLVRGILVSRAASTLPVLHVLRSCMALDTTDFLNFFLYALCPCTYQLGSNCLFPPKRTSSSPFLLLLPASPPAFASCVLTLPATLLPPCLCEPGPQTLLHRAAANFRPIDHLDRVVCSYLPLMRAQATGSIALFALCS